MTATRDALTLADWRSINSSSCDAFHASTPVPQIAAPIDSESLGCKTLCPDRSTEVGYGKNR